MTVSAAPAYALFLDFDGTLVEIAARPEAVVVSPTLPGVLRLLRDRLDGALAIVTGRPVAALDTFLPGLDLDGCGLHGLECRRAGRTSLPPGLADLTDDIVELKRRLARHDDLVIEDKTVGVAVHWRLAPDAETEARAAIDDLASRLGPRYRIQNGKAVSEIVPANAGKGNGIRTLLEQPPYAGRIPVFVGDDRTDEDGFAAVNELAGISIKIGDGPTCATRRVASPAAFAQLLGRWAVDGLDPEPLAGS